GDNASVPAGLTEAANGGARIQVGTVDIGAAETNLEARSLVVTTDQDVVDATDGLTSLREAIAFANDTTANGGSGDADGDGFANDTITFASNLSGKVLYLASGELAITSDLTIDGDIDNDTAPDITIDADSALGVDDATTRVLSIDGGAGTATVTLTGLTIRDGDAAVGENGGGILLGDDDALTLTDSAVLANAATASVTVPFSVVVTGGSGGGIFADSGSTLTIDNTDISGNQNVVGQYNAFTGAGVGGGIYAGSGAIVSITDSTIDANLSGQNTVYRGSGGGGLALYSSASLSIDNTVISNNSTFRLGGGLLLHDVPTVTITDSAITGNAASVRSGALESRGSSGILKTVTVSNSLIADNSANGIVSGAGGFNNTTLTFENTTITRNLATGSIGAVNTSESSRLYVTNSTVTGNTAGNNTTRDNAGLNVLNTATISNSIVAGNYVVNGTSKVASDIGGTQDAGGGSYVPGTITLDGVNIIGTLQADTDNAATLVDSSDDIVLGLGGTTSQNVAAGTTLADIFDTLVTIDPDSTPASGDEFDTGALANNGGPTQTIALKSIFANPALDASGGTSLTASDARGVAAQDVPTVGNETGTGIRDLGAFEALAAGINLPPVAQDDAVTTDEDTLLNGDVLADNGSGADTDADSDPLTVTLVNGSAGNVGNQITLASGALLLVNATGGFTYDPNGQFEGLSTGQSDTDSFTYTIDDGSGGTDTATVQITVDGVNDLPTGTGLPTDTLAADKYASPIDLTGLALADVDASALTLALAATDGTLSAASGSGITAALSNSNHTLSLTGTIADLGTFLATPENVRYLNATGDIGTNVDTIAATINDNQGSGDIAIGTIAVSVVAPDPATTGDDVINGTFGDDLILALAGNDTVFGAGGNDTIFGEAGNDGLDGGPGNDDLFGGPGDDNLFGLAGNDRLHGNGGADVLIGGEGDDWLFVDSLDRLIDGGNGFDRVNITNGNGISFNVTLASVELVNGNAGADNFDGSASTDALTLRGRSGDDVLKGGAGNDYIYGDAGADQLFGGAGLDRLFIDENDTVIDGGAGNADRVIVQQLASAPTGVTVDMAASNVEIAYGNHSDDTFDGSSSTVDLSLYGRQGQDMLIGGSANDRLFGDTNDTAAGDILNGGQGNDFLNGGTNTAGWAERDQFVFDADWGNDRIFDFANNGAEKIDFSSIAGITQRSDLGFTDVTDASGTYALISYTDIAAWTGTIRVYNVAEADLQGNDFIFV
ncbi:MAG: hypothetical protein KDJ77_14310, partial [Rhodobiaceae bacterium]|nr:hypothetical protein [Rhodobiaceae bacterium]